MGKKLMRKKLSSVCVCVCVYVCLRTAWNLVLKVTEYNCFELEIFNRSKQLLYELMLSVILTTSKHLIFSFSPFFL